MKNYLVKATRDFDDTVEQDEYGANIKRISGQSVWNCTKERYEFLKENNAVILMGIEHIEEPKPVEKKTTKKASKK